MTDFAQYPFDALQAVGSSLTTISDQVSAQSRTAFDVLGFSADQSRIDDALGRFRSEWQASLKKLGENIAGFGSASTQIGTLSAQFDAELAAALRPGGPVHAARSAAGPV